MTADPTIEARARDIVAALTIEQLVGLLFHPILFASAPFDLDARGFDGGPSLRELIVDRGIRFFCVSGPCDLATFAATSAPLQDLARSSGSGLPIVFSTDPRHSFIENAGAAHRASGVSQWPEPLGFGAIDDVDLVREFADLVRRDYVAAGIRMALHPQVDLASEPRWARQAQSFGSDPEASARLVTAFLEGIQGPEWGAGSVAATTKHFPGGGPQLDGDDPHFPYGREQVYPGGRFEDHLLPFRAAIAAKSAAVMPYYGMPVGLEIAGEPIEEVGFAFSRQIITGQLRERLGYDGVVLTDFGLVTDAELFGKPFPARAWGVEHLTPIERVLKLIDAGCDQLGGESATPLLLELLADGRVSEARIAESAERLVALQLRLGLLDEHVAAPAGIMSESAAGRRSQSRAVTILENGRGLLPLTTAERRVHLHGVDARALPPGWSSADPEDADFAIVRLAAPFESRDVYFLEAGMQQGSLEFPADVIDEVHALAERVPVVLVVMLSRPAILTPFAGRVSALAADFGASDEALLDALTGRVVPEGRLPFELPRGMKEVDVNLPDVPNDTLDPLFPVGWRVDV